jgi:hypothetical protein
MQPSNRSYVFGAFNSSKQDESYLAFRTIVPRSTKLPDPEREWNESKLRELEKAAARAECLWCPPFKLVEPKEFSLFRAPESERVNLRERNRNVRKIFAALKLGSVTREEADQRGREPVVLKPNAGWRVSDDIHVAAGVIRACVIKIENPDNLTFSAIHIEHRAKRDATHENHLIGEMTLLFMPYYSPLD